MEVERLKVSACISVENGDTLQVKLKDKDDFLNGAVPEGQPVLLITKSMKVLKGKFMFVDVDSDGVYIYE